MATVKFTDVGGRKMNWEAQLLGELTYEFLYGQIRKKGALYSSGIEFTTDGAIIAGFRTVGRFEVLPQAIDTTEIAQPQAEAE